ncbi:UDP-N-acetylmuramoyl-L-alanyl-D-glutamate--2,6-diaminopimelate ligase [Endozoicomonas lisbonensis]|uniref:UDP-N-acetylmuramoyl-L-alanyl-D-glutamate--2,6-diaminopimelate ligase n=1 Tax=Endozoicomonas lisbonensis TaxID=3120522 RepID=A0ABV2SN97_9GAMM
MADSPLSTLNEVLAVLDCPPIELNKPISGLTLDSRKLVGGELFLAVPGLVVDGRQYIDAAVSAGAAAVLAESEEAQEATIKLSHADAKGVPVIFVSGLKNRIGFLADRFYRQPSANLNVVGVTGTNGKTSCCWFIAQLLSMLQQPCAVMGTIGKGVPPSLEPCLNTTADPVSLHQYMAELGTSGVKAMAMEVSSHGLDQGRVDGVQFDVGVFTNISRDHLDYHCTLDAYAKAKSLLFADGRVKQAVINLDDDYSDMMLKACGSQTQVLTYSTSNPEADVYAESFSLTADGLLSQIRTPWGSGQLRTSLLGRFNLENLLAVLSCICVQGYTFDQVLPLISRLTTVPGRMQRFGGSRKPIVVVDYAHTPDALESVLEALREHGASRLTCVFGCGGDRDRGKRPLMTRAAVNGADKVVVTSDNPRSEDPGQIIADAVHGVDFGEVNVVTEIDRAKAIASTIAEAQAREIVVVAGKGHEDYQEVKGKRLPFDDRDHVSRALSQWREL